MIRSKIWRTSLVFGITRQQVDLYFSRQRDQANRAVNRGKKQATCVQIQANKAIAYAGTASGSTNTQPNQFILPDAPMYPFLSNFTAKGTNLALSNPNPSRSRENRLRLCKCKTIGKYIIMD